MMTLTTCGRCQRHLRPADAEVCWYCHAALCGPCWDAYGHCGHAEADAFNAAIRQGDDPIRAGHPPPEEEHR